MNNFLLEVLDDIISPETPKACSTIRGFSRSPTETTAITDCVHLSAAELEMLSQLALYAAHLKCCN